MSIVLFCGFESESRTPNRLSRNLGAILTRSIQVPRSPSVLIRWGSPAFEFLDGEYDDVFNNSGSIIRNKRKKSASRMLNMYVPSPRVYSSFSHIRKFPVIARNNYHSNGDDAIFIKDRTDEMYSDYYTQYIPKKREFRVHAMRGVAFLITEKRPRNRKQICWNSAEEQAPKPILSSNMISHLTQLSLITLRVLRLDFGAIDIIQSSKDKKLYVLEANTGPLLESTKPYVDAFNRFIPSIYRKGKV